MMKLCVGYSTGLKDNALKLLPEPQAPKNYKDPMKIQEYIEKERIRYMEEAYDKPLTARFKDITWGEAMYDDRHAITNIDDIKLLTPLIEDLSNFVNCASGSKSIYVFKPSVFRKLLAYIVYNAEPGAKKDGITKLLFDYESEVTYIDPSVALFGVSLDVNTLASELGIEISQADSHAFNSFKICREVARRL